MDITYTFDELWNKLKEKANNAPDDTVEKLAKKNACKAGLDNAHAAADFLGILNLDITVSKPDWITAMETKLSPPYTDNPLKDAFDNGTALINGAITQFGQITNPITNAARNGFMDKVDVVRQHIDEALHQGELLAARLQGILGDIGSAAHDFITNLPDVSTIDDQIVDLIIQQIVEAVKTGEAKLNEQNLMIYAGEFKSGFQFNIPAVQIGADFNFQIGPGTS